MAGMLKYLYVPLFDRFTELSWRGRAAWIALCFFAQWSKAEGNVGRCWPSQETLARMMGVSISTVIRGLKELRELGIVRCEERSDGETCGYVLQIEGVCLSDRGGLSLRQTNNTNNNTNNTDTLTRERFERLFSGLWEQFRQFNGTDKGAARAELKRLFPVGLPMRTALELQARLVGLLNEQAPRWQQNLDQGTARFNPSFGNWLKRQSLPGGGEVLA